MSYSLRQIEADLPPIQNYLAEEEEEEEEEEEVRQSKGKKANLEAIDPLCPFLSELELCLSDLLSLISYLSCLIYLVFPLLIFHSPPSALLVSILLVLSNFRSRSQNAFENQT